MRCFPKIASIPLLVAIVLVAATATGPTPAHACDFEEPPSPEVALDEAYAVFAGEVVSIEPVDDDPSDQFDAVTFAVDRAWKGIESSPVTVETHQDEATCGYPFQQGDSYLVYAYGGDGYLTTALYHRTAPLDRADQDLDALGEGTEVTAEAQVDGSTDNGDDRLNPGIIVLLVIGLSILVATVIMFRQSKPGFSRDDDDLDSR